MIDPINQKKHLVITDAERVPVTSTTGHDFGEVKLSPGTTINSWAKCPAPPEDVETISVYIPGVVPFEEIPISR